MFSPSNQTNNIISLKHYFIQHLLILSSTHLLIFCQKDAKVENLVTNVAEPLPLLYCCIVLWLKGVFCEAKNRNNNRTIQQLNNDNF